MENFIVKKLKIFLIVTLAVIVVGMTLFGVFGFNNAVREDKNYEVTIRVDQNLSDAGSIIKNQAEKYFDEIGASYFNYQQLKEGSAFVYSFKDNVIKQSELDEILKSSVAELKNEDGELINVVATATVKEVLPTAENQVLDIFFALLIASAIILIYLLILEKPAVAFTTLINGILSLILFISVASIVRIPAYININVFIVASFVLSMVISAVICSRFKEIASSVGGEKMTNVEITSKSIKDSFFRVIIFLAIISLASICLLVAFTPYLVYAFVYMLIAGIVSVYSAILGSIFFLPVLKNIDKRA